MKRPKILLMDLETSPNLGWIWGKYEQDVLAYEKEWRILCFAYKWLDKRGIVAHALPDFPLFYKKDTENDAGVVQKLWELLDEADIVIAHNGDQFDIKKSNARFLAHGMAPPSPYKTIDTLKLSRKHFRFNSNKLNDLAVHLGIGKKVETGGFKLWKGCMDGDLTSWKKMVKYNKQDVQLLEDVYLVLRPWSTTHPNLNLLQKTTHDCPICGEDALQKRGFNITRTCKYQRYQCQSCGGWSQSRTSEPALKPDVK